MTEKINFNESDKIYLTTKSGLKFSISFSKESPDYSKLADFFLLLAQKQETKKGQSNDTKYRKIKK